MKFKKEKKINFSEINYKFFKLKLKVTSSEKIRDICLQKNEEGIFMGRIWKSFSVINNIKKINGGIFCESAFGEFKIGICNCNKKKWITYPKFPKKLRRFEVFTCKNCLTQTIYNLFEKNIFIGNIIFPFKEKFFSKINKYFYKNPKFINFIEKKKIKKKYGRN